MQEQNPLYGVSSRDPDRSINVLVVDDDSAIRHVIRRILEDNGHTVFEAKDGLDGIEMFRSDPHRFNAVVLDLEMPRLNGFDTFWQIRAIRTDIPVIVVSGCAPEEYRHRLPVSELAGFLSKPFQIDELLSTVVRSVPVNEKQDIRTDRI